MTNLIVSIRTVTGFHFTRSELGVQLEKLPSRQYEFISNWYGLDGQVLSGRKMMSEYGCSKAALRRRRLQIFQRLVSRHRNEHRSQESGRRLVRPCLTWTS